MTFLHFGTPKKSMLKHDFLDVKQAEKHASADSLFIFGLKIDFWDFFSQLKIWKNTKANLWLFFHVGLQKKDMPKHDFLDVKQAQNHASADSFVIFGLKIDL